MVRPAPWKSCRLKNARFPEVLFTFKNKRTVAFDTIESHISRYLLEALGSSRVKLAMVLLGRSCQNELMSSNNFDVKVAVKKYTKVEVSGKQLRKKP